MGYCCFSGMYYVGEKNIYSPFLIDGAKNARCCISQGLSPTALRKAQLSACCSSAGHMFAQKLLRLVSTTAQELPCSQVNNQGPILTCVHSDSLRYVTYNSEILKVYLASSNKVFKNIFKCSWWCRWEVDNLCLREHQCVVS